MCSSHGCAPIHRACLLKVKQKCWADLGLTCSCLANTYKNVQNWRKDELHHCCPLVPATFDVTYARICSYLLILVSLILAGPKEQLKHWGQSHKRICFEKKKTLLNNITLSARKCLLVSLVSYAAKTLQKNSKEYLWQTPLCISHRLHMQALAGISTWRITGGFSATAAPLTGPLSLQAKLHPDSAVSRLLPGNCGLFL